jgi:calcineurin-like phosphoesterase family protein
MQSTVDIDKYNNVYVTSDWHLSHKNILKYDKNRNFESLDEMNEYIISTVEATLQE